MLLLRTLLLKKSGQRHLHFRETVQKTLYF